MNYTDRKKWDDYSEKYNLLSKKMRESGLNLDLLDDVIRSYERLIEVKNNAPPYQSLYQSQP